MRGVLISVLFLVFSMTVFPQQARQYAFKQFTTLNGLASNEVGSVIQDREGYIWIGTQNGLQRYDGSQFITLVNRVSDSSSIPTNFITSMYIDRKGNFWLIGGNNKVGIFDSKRFFFKEVLS